MFHSGNYLEQGVNRIVDQVVNPKIASVFIPQVEELFYNHLGIQRPKPIIPVAAETSNGKIESDLLPTDLEAVSPGSVKSNDDKEDVRPPGDGDNMEEMKMDIDEASQPKEELKEESQEPILIENAESQLSGISDLTSHGSDSVDNSAIPLPSEIKPENIPLPDDSPPKIELDKIELPKDTDIPLPEIPLPATPKESFFKPIQLESGDEDSCSDSSLIRNMSPLTPIRNFDDENSCDAQQGFDTEVKDEPEPQPASFRFTIEANKSSESSQDGLKTAEKKDPEPNLSYQFESQVNLNTYTTPLYEDSSNSNALQIDYESDVSKTNTDAKLPEPDQSSQDVKKEKAEDKKSHKSSRRSRDSHRHGSSSKDRRSDSKHSSSRDKDTKHDKKPSSKDESSSNKSKSSHRERSRDRGDKKDRRDSSKHSQSLSHKSSSSSKDSKNRSSSSSQKHSPSKRDVKKSSSSSHREKSSSKDHKSKDSKSSSHRSDKDKKSSASRKDEKDKKEKKETDDHYSLSGRGNIHRRSTDRDSNDGNSSSSKGSNLQSRNTDTNAKKEKSSSSKSETTSSSSGTSPSDKELVVNNKMSQARNLLQAKSAVRIENHLESPAQQSPVRFMPEVILKKPKFASNLEEAKKMMKMRKFLDEEQRRMNQEAALLLEFQANVRPNMSQAYSNISGPELEFACENNDSKESNAESLIMEEITLEDLAVVQENFFDTETIESLAEIQKEVDDINIFTSDTQKEHVKGDESRTSDDLLKDLSETEDNKQDVTLENEVETTVDTKVEEDSDELRFFTATDKYVADTHRDSFAAFLKTYTERNTYNNKLHLVNCSKYQEDLFRDLSSEYEVISYHRNGHGPQKSAKHVDFNHTEVTIPSPEVRSTLLSPVRSEYSFELSSDYNAKLENMMHTTSRQEIMEIILGGMVDDSPTKMPKIDICKESSIEVYTCKRRFSDTEGSDNNNRQVLTPRKIRKISASEQISSTTEGVYTFFFYIRQHINIYAVVTTQLRYRCNKC